MNFTHHVLQGAKEGIAEWHPYQRRSWPLEGSHCKSESPDTWVKSRLAGLEESLLSRELQLQKEGATARTPAGAVRMPRDQKLCPCEKRCLLQNRAATVPAKAPNSAGRQYGKMWTLLGIG